MRDTTRVFFTALGLLLVSPSYAGIMISTDAGTDLGNGLTGYRVSAIGTEGDTVQSLVNVSFSGVHQVWRNAGSADQPSPEKSKQGIPFWDASWTPFDSVFNFNATNNAVLSVAPGTTFSESNSLSNPYGVSTANSGLPSFPGAAGVGNLGLNGQVTFLQAGGFPSLEFAYVVVPTGATASYSAQFFTSTGTMPTAALTGEIGAVVDPATGNPPAGDISGLLQGAFDTRGSSSSPAILPIMIMDGAVQSFDLVVDQPELASFVQVEALAEVGKYNLILSGPFETLDPGTILSGSLSFVTDNGNVDYTFSVNVPEPSTVALTGLAMVGLVGFFRRKSS